MVIIQVKPAWENPKLCLKYLMCSWRTQECMNVRLKILVEEMSSEDSYKYTVSVTAHTIVLKSFLHI